MIVIAIAPSGDTMRGRFPSSTRSHAAKLSASRSVSTLTDHWSYPAAVRGAFAERLNRAVNPETTAWRKTPVSGIRSSISRAIASAPS